ncbi:superoxide dismutase family protein [Cellulomonas sp. S1-8]|uniref:superoxide dismutase family protein n=1 Tax=Cellulomonas sp. S1-8 TaxID=2904790 RepID=UPI0022449A06|nr:superoxide dismutase family protein [Cellulomonas sp. S1-8]UZN03093.1 superoxide dismutase family protein [Cellulomonas sp. S1-8]
MRGTLRATLVAVALAAALTACSDQGDADDNDDDPGTAATATSGSDGQDDDTELALLDATGAQVGTASVDEEAGGVEIEVEVSDMPPGFHGFHLHAVGVCEPDSPDPADPAKVGDFLSAGGHVGADAADHGAHHGDLPPLLVDSSGSGTLTVRTDAVTLADLQDEDGTAVMVHADPDNVAHIPERYAAGGPDEATRKTGDAGDRVACGVVAG